MLTSKTTAPVWASYALAGIALFVVLKVGLLVALFSGLLVYSLIHLLAPTIEKKFSSKQSRMIAVIFLSVVIIATISLSLWLLYVYLRSEGGNLNVLLQKMADIIDASSGQMPDWISNNLPEGADALRELLTNGFREHASEAKLLVQEAGHVIVHLLLGMIIGSMVALQETTELANYRPFAAALHDRVTNLGIMFQKIVFAQVRISLINTAFTAVYLLIILPIAGIHLPLTKSMIVITFLAGLIPVVGNILSNTVIVVVSLSHSLHTAVASLVFMVVIHKLEYFLNAKIIGSQVNARSWELLTAILVMETMFGVPGVVAAPVFYAYIKKELKDKELV